MTSSRAIRKTFQRDLYLGIRDASRSSSGRDLMATRAREMYCQIMGKTNGPYSQLANYWRENSPNPPIPIEEVASFLVRANESRRARELARHFNKAELIGNIIPSERDGEDEFRARYGISQRKTSQPHTECPHPEVGGSYGESRANF